MELHPDEQLIWRGHPSTRSSVGFYLEWGLLALLPVAFAGIFKANGRGTGFEYHVWLLISLGLLVAVMVVDVLRRASIDYILTTRRIRIRRGVLSRREQSTTVARVQNINTDQGPLDRMLGIGTVGFDTAGTESDTSTFSFVGVSDPHGLVRKFEVYLAELRNAAPEPPRPG